MCQVTLTLHKKCGCQRVHTLVACSSLFDSSLPTCKTKRWTDNWRETACPECSPRPQHKGTFAQIDQNHNQFRHLTRQEKELHKFDRCLDWIEDPTNATPAFNDMSQLEITTSPSPSPDEVATEPRWMPDHTPNPARSPPIPLEQRRFVIRRRERGFVKTTPPPLPAPENPTTRRHTVRVRNEYTLTARNTTLTASQREVMARAGHPRCHRLSIVSRRHLVN